MQLAKYTRTYIALILLSFFLSYNPTPVNADRYEGIRKSYYPGGKLKEEKTYHNGLLNGPFKSYHENGNLKGEATYKDGKINGIVRTYYPDGELKAEVNFKDGRKHGARKVYKDQQLLITETYVDGKPNENHEGIKSDALTKDTQQDVYYRKGVRANMNKDYKKAIYWFKKSIEHERNIFAYNSLSQTYVLYFKDYSSALDVYKDLIKFKPDEVSAYFSAADLQERLGNIEMAIKYCKDGLKLKPDKSSAASAHFMLGRFYRDQKKHDKSKSHIDKAIRIYKELSIIETDKEGSARVHLDLGRIYEYQGVYSDARREYEEVVKLGLDYLSKLATFKVWNLDQRKGISFYENKEYQNAIDLFEKLLNQNPDDKDSLRWLGHSYQGVGKYNDAVTAYKSLIELDPNDKYAHAFLGNSYKEVGKYNDAITAYKSAIKLGIKDKNVLYNLGNSYKEVGEHNDAIAAYKSALELDPKYSYALLSLGRAYSEVGKYNDAIAAYKSAIELDPKNKIALFQLGRSYSEVGKYNKAIQYYKEVLKLMPDDSTTLGWLGLSYYALKKFSEAEVSYTKALSIDPDLSDAHYGLGSIYSTMRRYKKAEMHYLEALKQKQTTADWSLTLGGLGGVYLELNEIGKAEKYFKESFNINPDVSSHYRLGGFYQNQKRYKEATHHYIEVISFGPGTFADLAKEELGHIESEGGGYTVLFRDDFNDSFLSPEWELINPDEKNIIIENDHLLALFSKPALKNQSNSWPARNVLFLADKLPSDKDWVATIRFKIDFVTLTEDIRLGVADSEGKKMMYAAMSSYSYPHGNNTQFAIKSRSVKDKIVHEKDVIKYPNQNDRKGCTEWYAERIPAIQLRYEKRGRRYIASMMLEPKETKDKTDPKGVWVTVPAQTSLRAPGNLFIMFSASGSNEGTIEVDWVEVKEVK